jgi:D-sedoheptulose 7-phosphate isomerase
MKDQIAQRLRELAATALSAAERLGPDAERAGTMMRDALRGGGTLFFCGNGGSAADAQHLATEYVVRYMKNRRALPAVALTTDTSLITATGNDFGFEEVFSRQVEALVGARDLLIIHSTSGNSPNVIKAAEAAKRKGAPVVAFSSVTAARCARSRIILSSCPATAQTARRRSTSASSTRSARSSRRSSPHDGAMTCARTSPVSG